MLLFLFFEKYAENPQKNKQKSKMFPFLNQFLDHSPKKNHKFWPSEWKIWTKKFNGIKILFFHIEELQLWACQEIAGFAENRGLKASVLRNR